MGDFEFMIVLWLGTLVAWAFDHVGKAKQLEEAKMREDALEWNLEMDRLGLPHGLHVKVKPSGSGPGR